MFYLQSRYYDPEVGRFINADAYASTGQGIIGNNMFAYCNNNAVNLADSSGKAPWPTTVAIKDGGASYNGPSTFRSPPPIPAEYGGDVALNFKHLIRDVADLGLGANKIRTGKNHILTGFTLIYAPIPTPIDELLGLGKVLMGSFQMIMGVGQVLLFEEE